MRFGIRILYLLSHAYLCLYRPSHDFLGNIEPIDMLGLWTPEWSNLVLSKELMEVDGADSLCPTRSSVPAFTVDKRRSRFLTQNFTNHQGMGYIKTCFWHLWCTKMDLLLLIFQCVLSLKAVVARTAVWSRGVAAAETVQRSGRPVADCSFSACWALTSHPTTQG